MASNIKNRAVSGVFWSGVEKFGSKIGQFILGLVLARLLTPEDYGILGILLVFLNVSQTFVDSGFSVALIQKKDATEKEFSTVFWFNLVVSSFLYGILFIVAPFVSRFYSNITLIALLRVLMLTLIVNAFGSTQRTLMRKKIDFKSIAKVNTLSIFGGGTVGILLAYAGFGVWSLVYQQMSKFLIQNVGYWILSHWKPKVEFSKDSFRELFNYGKSIFLAALLYKVYKNIYNLIIGKLFSPDALGYFTRANQFKNLPVDSVYETIMQVTFPVLSELQDDHQRLRAVALKFIRLISFIMFPMMMYLAISSRELIIVLLTEKWLPTAPLLSILCLSGLLYPIQAINVTLLKVIGRSDLFLKLEFIKIPMSIVGMGIGLLCGLTGFVVSMPIVSFLFLFVNSYYPQRLLQFELKMQMDGLKKIILSTGISSVLTLLVKSFVVNVYLILIVNFITMVTIYLLMAFIIKSKELSEFFNQLKIILSKIRKKK